MKIKTKIPLYTGVTVLVTMLTVTLFSISEFRKSTLKSIESYRIEQTENIKKQLKDHVYTTYKILDNSYSEIKNNYHHKSVNFEKYPIQLQQSIKDIEQISFGDAGYIWLNEVNPPYTVIMHPIKPEMNGTVQVFYIKDTQQNVYEAFADVIKKNNGEGFLEYDYFKPGTNERIPKLSFIKLFEPLGWVIGTGVYVDFIDKMVAKKTEELNSQTNKMIRIILLLGLILIAIATFTLFYFSRNITNAIYSVKQKLFHMSKGHIIKTEKNLRSDEIGDMNKSLNELIKGVNTYSEFALNIEKGRLDADFIPLSKNDNLGISLLDMRNSLKLAKEEEAKRTSENERQNRANKAYTMFSELMRKGSDNINELSYQIISNLIEYIKGIQGGIFILNDENADDIFLELTASIAYSRRKFNKKRIEIGDGLIGACAYEKKKIYINNVPNNYAEIRSGLGTSAPKSILIIPLLMEDNLIGIIELASLIDINKFDIEFVEKVSESIAASLYATKINAKSLLLQNEYNRLLREKESFNSTLVEKEKDIKRLRRKLSKAKDDKSILSL